MAKQPYISHSVNGYSRYDLPESKAFTCTPGILYPVRIDFINARDRVKIAQGIDVRSNPLSVPTFNPYTVRLHRFWVPLQLYHPELRTNSSDFDMNNLSLNFLRTYVNHSGSTAFYKGEPFSNSLMAWLRVVQRSPLAYTGTASPHIKSDVLVGTTWANADSYLAYWDIVRNYYSFSQYPIYSFAWPMSWVVTYDSSKKYFALNHTGLSSYFSQRYGDLSYLDRFFETQFYPGAFPDGTMSESGFNRMGLFVNIINSDITSEPTSAAPPSSISTSLANSPLFVAGGTSDHPADKYSASTATGPISLVDLFVQAHPLAVCPASPDRLSRLLPGNMTSDAVSMSGITSIPQLAVAARLQEYKDLLGAGGSRYSDWLETFFASRIEHVDRPKLLFSASQTVNAQIVMSTVAGGGPSAGISSFLGQQGGSIAFNTQLGRSQSYYFREPGYLIDMFSIRPVYYWQNIKPDYLRYQGADYFNPIYNDIGYQEVPFTMFSNLTLSGSSPTSRDITLYREPCFNEFRASYDEALGDFGSLSSYASTTQKWIQSRSVSSLAPVNKNGVYSNYSTLFVDISTVNSPFTSVREDNFFVNLSYSVQKKNLVNKSFATRLSNR